MRKFLRKLWHSKKGFTLLECVLAVAIIALVSSSMVPVLGIGQRTVMNAKRMDELAAHVQHDMILYPTPHEEDDSGFSVSFSDEVPVEVEFVIHLPGETQQIKDTVIFIAAVGQDGLNDNKVLLYDISPQEADKLYNKKDQ
jgi:prepilin-type N-terminal cleavage/methylation domain-containing protein